MSEKVQALKKRSEVEESLKWDLSRIFKTEQDYHDNLEQMKEAAIALEKDFKGKIKTTKDIQAVLDNYCKFLIMIEHAGSYAQLDMSVDMTDEKAQKRYNLFNQLAAKVMTQVKFVETEIMELEDQVLHQSIQELPQYATYLTIIMEHKPHHLSGEMEELLVSLSPALSLPQEGYEITKLSDMQFPDFEVEGQKYPLSYVLFENVYQHDPDTKKRRGAFEGFSAKLREYINTTASYYQSQTQTEKTLSNLRGFDSVLDYLLLDQRVSRDLYNRQIDLITTHLAPHMQRYAKLLQKVHGLDKMTFADLKISLDPGFDPKVTIEESEEYVQGALSVLGQEYLDLVMKSYQDRWVDYAQNIGKSTGGFCASPYQKDAFILLSWTGMLSEVFTLVHELGHGGHFALAQKHNNILEVDCSLYFVEAPSTCNEMLLSNYLMTKSQDPRFKRWVLASMISNTYFHNFVTHLLEAAYQRKVYEAVDKGESLQAGDYSSLKKGVLEAFWGDAVHINEGAELTWMRQPHYYMGLYPYTYSAGLTIATQVSQRILKEGDVAAQAWVNALKAGGSKNPAELAAMAGVDITTDQALLDTIAFIGGIIDQLEKLTEEMEHNQ